MTTLINRTNLLPSPYDTAAVGAVPVKFSVYVGLNGTSVATVSANTYGGRPVLRATVPASPATSMVGFRPKKDVNNPALPEGTAFWFGMDVFIPSNVTGPNLFVIFRDDPNNNSSVVTLDDATPYTRPLSGIPRDVWTRLWYKGVVKTGFTVTTVSVYTNGDVHAPGEWWETTRWCFETQASQPNPDAHPTAPEYFDGGSPNLSLPMETREFAWTGAAVASISTAKITTYSQSLHLTWRDDQGAVRFEANDLRLNDTVRMVGPNGRLVALRGYETAEWHLGATTGYGYHFEMPLGMWVQYAIADVEATYVDDATMTTAYIETPDNEAWLRDLNLPMLSQKVTVVSTDDEVRQGRQTIVTIAGRSNPLSLYDIRLSRSGTITLIVSNEDWQGWGDTSKDHMDLLLYSGRPLLFSMCMSKGFPPCYMAASDATYTKISSRANWLLKINYQEVDNPVDVGLVITPEVTWDMARSMPRPTALFQDWKDTYPTFLDLVLDRPQGGTPEPPPEDVPE